jgi:hypothetical protein
MPGRWVGGHVTRGCNFEDLDSTAPYTYRQTTTSRVSILLDFTIDRLVEQLRLLGLILDFHVASFRWLIICESSFVVQPSAQACRTNHENCRHLSTHATVGTDLDISEVGYETRALLSSSDDGERLDVVARAGHATPLGQAIHDMLLDQIKLHAYYVK